jgi:hypothetical protein
VQRLEYAAGKGYLPLLRAVHKMLDTPLWAKEGLTSATHDEASESMRIMWSDGSLSRMAATNGQLRVLQYLHKVRYPLCKGICYCAAEVGHLNCLQYAHEHGCPWDAGTCFVAAEGGHLDCLQYAHEHGCPWDADTCAIAANGGHLDCLQYVHEH